MNLKLKNIGIIEKANIKLDGLTVIAGENDSGKSTVGKVIYSFLKTILSVPTKRGVEPLCGWHCSRFNDYLLSLFNNQISTNGEINIRYNENDFNIIISSDRCKIFESIPIYEHNAFILDKPLFIDSPYIWNILPSLKTIVNLESQKINVDFKVNKTINDLYVAITSDSNNSKETINLDIKSIIKGEFIQRSDESFSFQKEGKNIALLNTAMGIKYFGILQVLSEKNHLYKGQMLILDEPEVHLHPKWQLELAKVIVFLVKEGVEILVNSHSPYMIEALERYSEQYDIKNKTNFYLAHNNTIEKVEDSNSRTLSVIFEKLSEPFDVFENMKSDRL